MEIYHLINRGVEKRPVVLDDADRARFVHDLFVFNDAHPAQHPHQPSRVNEQRRRSKLIRIHAYCLMENHYHILASEIQTGGISLFMKKLNMGYAKYFNERYGRSGYLWQGKYRKKPVTRAAHFLYVPYYIHLNPLDYVLPEWRKGMVSDWKTALGYLENYRWSSHRDYLGLHNFPSVIERKELDQIFLSRKSYEESIQAIISDPEIALKSELFEE